ncbi:glycosyltransferase family 1 protein [Komarekiella sp. 'clone 1']|uniref:Glycosyltransferase family 1 protein n=1 Tax=Komarekiella delphini-convector SJRDD-AB1 TaxID=2593771 RepID=A0AA40VSK7_9NOST|nr:glycosyltransferase family 1 protein [Komarekiella delphini-convector]MBD6618269.1 glycosyltransferase family 1 protein [Komarekiella delphini-convector SJRDD-AB1]
MTLVSKPSIRILQVVGGMNRAGTETWLMHILRHIDRDRFQIDFLVHTTKPCAYDQEIRTLGGQIIPCLKPSQPLLYARNFRRILDEYGPYDIIHSHVHHFSGYILRLARQAGVPVRIAHSHFDSSSLAAKARWHKRLYLALMERWIAFHATAGLACSYKAAEALFGVPWKTDPRWQILYCGVDLKPFQTFIDPVTVRAEFGIPKDAFVIGHVGRFEQAKNHQFLLDIAVEVIKREPRMYLLLVGDGSLRPDIEQKAMQMGLAGRVIFTGVRPDVARIMLGAMDAFLFPSLHEGLGLVLIEAQAAGLPCIFSDVVPQEADAIAPLVQRISLLQPASIWAEAVIATTKQNKLMITQPEALAIIQKSKFDIRKSTNQLQFHYVEQLNKALYSGSRLSKVHRSCN